MLNFLKRTALWIIAVPLLVFCLGTAMNQAVLVANHDRFPVMWNTYKAAHYEMEIQKAVETADDPDKAEQAAFDLEGLRHGYLDDTHCLMDESTHLNFLADWIDFQTATYSPGDLILELGDSGLTYAPFIWAALAIRRLNKKED